MGSLSGPSLLQQLQDAWNLRGNVMIWPRQKVILNQRVCLLEEEEVERSEVRVGHRGDTTTIDECDVVLIAP